MIFVTVGTQLPFDRMIRAVDEWASATGRPDVLAQIGPGKFVPGHIQYQRFMSPQQCDENMRSAHIIIAHAGMGTIIGALELGTPLVIVPRQASLGEHRNDHQLATARRFESRPGIAVAADEHEIAPAIERLSGLPTRERLSPFASPQLIAAIRSFIHADVRAAEPPAHPSKAGA